MTSPSPRFTVAITGGIASGKSMVCRRFEALGVAIADADVIAREQVAPGQPALAEIVARFGNGVMRPDRSLDRAALRTLVFENEAARHALESILHPRIRAALRDACAKADSPYAIAAIPLLAEGGGRDAYPWLDRILVVDAPRETRIARLMVRDGGSREQAERILAIQAKDRPRIALADDVIDNSGTPDAIDAQVDTLHELYLRLAASLAAG